MFPENFPAKQCNSMVLYRRAMSDDLVIFTDQVLLRLFLNGNCRSIEKLSANRVYHFQYYRFISCGIKTITESTLRSYDLITITESKLQEYRQIL